MNNNSKNETYSLACGKINNIIVIESHKDALLFLEKMFNHHNDELSPLYCDSSCSRYFFYAYEPCVKTINMFMNANIDIWSDRSSITICINSNKNLNLSKAPKFPSWLIPMVS